MLLRDINMDGVGPVPINLTAVGDRVFFTATAPATGVELYVSDGTPEGTVLVKDLNPGTASSSPASLTVVGDRLFFVAFGPGTGRELWVTDGTPEGTTLLQDLNPGAASSSPGALTVVGDRLFFAADDGIHGHELWVVAPVRVQSVVVNDDSAQRSRVTSLTVTFSGLVTFLPDAFELRRADGTLVGLAVNTSEVDGKTVAVLTFTGADILAASLVDGDYTLTVRGDRMLDGIGRPIDGDGDGRTGGDRTDAFFRLFGDSDGDREVDEADLARFLGTFDLSTGDPDFLAFFDFDGNDTIDLTDLEEFLARFSPGP